MLFRPSVHKAYFHTFVKIMSFFNASITITSLATFGGEGETSSIYMIVSHSIELLLCLLMHLFLSNLRSWREYYPTVMLAFLVAATTFKTLILCVKTRIDLDEMMNTLFLATIVQSATALTLPFRETTIVATCFFATNFFMCVMVFTKADIPQSSGDVVTSIGVYSLGFAYLLMASVVVGHGIDTERRKLFLHERKFIRKMSSVKRLLNKKDLELGNFTTSAKENERVIDQVLSTEIIEQLSGWQILPQAIKFDDKLGSGSFGVVFHGTYRERPVAIKTMAKERVDATNMQRFISEILLMTRLHHPNIIGFVGCVLDRDNLSIILEYAKKGDLHSVQQTPAGQKCDFSQS